MYLLLLVCSLPYIDNNLPGLEIVPDVTPNLLEGRAVKFSYVCVLKREFGEANIEYLTRNAES
jgi:hypothetical protein